MAARAEQINVKYKLFHIVSDINGKRMQRVQLTPHTPPSNVPILAAVIANCAIGILKTKMRLSHNVQHNLQHNIHTYTQNNDTSLLSTYSNYSHSHTNPTIFYHDPLPRTLTKTLTVHQHSTPEAIEQTPMQ